MNKVHGGIKIQCANCENTFDTLTGMRQHANKIHGIRNDENCIYKCDICDDVRKFKKASDLKRHKESIHEDIPYDCDVCNQSFGCKSNRTSHVRNFHYDEKWIYMCDICDNGKKFKNTSDLKRHKECIHEGIRQHGCGFCDLSYNNKSSLDRHVKKFHLV